MDSRQGRSDPPQHHLTEEELDERARWMAVGQPAHNQIRNPTNAFNDFNPIADPYPPTLRAPHPNTLPPIRASDERRLVSNAPHDLNHNPESNGFPQYPQATQNAFMPPLGPAMNPQYANNNPNMNAYLQRYAQAPNRPPGPAPNQRQQHQQFNGVPRMELPPPPMNRPHPMPCHCPNHAHVHYHQPPDQRIYTTTVSATFVHSHPPGPLSGGLLITPAPSNLNIELLTDARPANVAVVTRSAPATMTTFPFPGPGPIPRAYPVPRPQHIPPPLPNNHPPPPYSAGARGMYAPGQYPPTNSAAPAGSSSGAGPGGRGYARGDMIHYDPENAEDEDESDDDSEEDSDEEMSIKEEEIDIKVEEIDNVQLSGIQNGTGIAGPSRGSHTEIAPMRSSHRSNNGSASRSSAQGSSQYAQHSRPAGNFR